MFSFVIRQPYSVCECNFFIGEHQQFSRLITLTIFIELFIILTPYTVFYFDLFKFEASPVGATPGVDLKCTFLKNHERSLVVCSYFLIYRRGYCIGVLTNL